MILTTRGYICALIAPGCPATDSESGAADGVSALQLSGQPVVLSLAPLFSCFSLVQQEATHGYCVTTLSLLLRPLFCRAIALLCVLQAAIDRDNLAGDEA